MTSKKTMLHVVICAGLICIIWVSYFLIRDYGIKRIFDVKEDDFSWVFQVDTVKNEGKKFILQGFAFELNKDVKVGNFEVVLQDIDSGKRYFPEMDYVEREDVNDYFLCKYDYLQSGFEARINGNRLDLQEKSYEVLLRMKDQRKAYRTGTYLVNGQLTYTSPQEYKRLEVDGTVLEEIVEGGVLRVYQPAYEMYVYQYEGELYWIAGMGYDFDEIGDTVIQYQLETPQVDKLPQYRIDNGWYWDNLGFEFESQEIDNYRTEKYRVAKMSIPKEYGVSLIWTGRYEEEWIWRQGFRPFYYFDDNKESENN